MRLFLFFICLINCFPAIYVGRWVGGGKEFSYFEEKNKVELAGFGCSFFKNTVREHEGNDICYYTANRVSMWRVWFSLDLLRFSKYD